MQLTEHSRDKQMTRVPNRTLRKASAFIRSTRPLELLIRRDTEDVIDLWVDNPGRVAPRSRQRGVLHTSKVEYNFQQKHHCMRAFALIKA